MPGQSYLAAKLAKSQLRQRQNSSPLTTARSGQGPSQGSSYPTAQQQTLAAWIIEAEEDARDRSDPERIWQLFQTNSFASLWYGAREAGEKLRAKALSQLYSHRTTPGGAHPDPRKPAAFSARAMLATAAAILGTTIWPVPESEAAAADSISAGMGHHGGKRQPQLAWIVTYTHSRAADIAVRQATTRTRQQEFDVACLLGYIAKEYARLADPDAPAGITLLPKDPGITTILHQFAIGLLGLPEDCPADWPCACNTMRSRYNMTPPDHERPTDQFAISQLQDYAARIRANGRTVTGLGYRAMPPVTPISAAEEWQQQVLEERDERDEQDTYKHPTRERGTGPLS